MAMACIQGCSALAFGLFVALRCRHMRILTIAGTAETRVQFRSSRRGLGGTGARPGGPLLHAFVLGVEQGLDVGDRLFRTDVLDRCCCGAGALA